MPTSSEFATIQSQLHLTFAPIAITFVDEPPSDVPRIDRSAPAACSYWRLAAEKRFYTTAADQDGCPVGAVTHGVPLSPAKAEELSSVVGTMLSLNYLQSDEPAGLPHRTQPFQYAVYEPLADVRGVPDLVIVRGGPRQMMVLGEAARAANCFASSPTMGRPACAMIPETLADQRAVVSLGCVGNRVYTGLPEDEMYVALPGAKLGEIARELEVIVRANDALEQFHQARAVAGV